MIAEISYDKWYFELRIRNFFPIKNRQALILSGTAGHFLILFRYYSTI